MPILSNGVTAGSPAEARTNLVRTGARARARTTHVRSKEKVRKEKETERKEKGLRRERRQLIPCESSVYVPGLFPENGDLASGVSSCRDGQRGSWKRGGRRTTKGGRSISRVPNEAVLRRYGEVSVFSAYVDPP